LVGNLMLIVGFIFLILRAWPQWRRRTLFSMLAVP
jgi:hypothetical protein